MKKHLLTFLSLFCAFATAFAGPTIYLRGNISGNWTANEAYRFTETSEGEYAITVAQLSGEFKIATSDWSTVDYGAATASNAEVTATGIYPMASKGLNFSCPAPLNNVTLSFTYRDGQPTDLRVSVDGGEPHPDSGTLPVLYINVYTDATHSALNNEIISRDLNHKNYFSDAEYWLDLNGCEWMAAEGAESIGSEEEPLPLEIKGRGNWTLRGFAKKPFKLKLGSKQKLCGLTKSKHFAILAHADDNFGYLRNFIGFNLGRRLGLPWTPDSRPVEVVINGDYRGLYFLTESIRVEPDRVDITELDDNVSDPALASGGYLVELDNYSEENQITMTEKVAPGVNPPVVDLLRVTFDTPEEYSDLQRRFVTDQFTAMNDAIGSNSDDTWRYLDLDDAARYYLVEEIVSHTESYHGSTYLFRDRGEGMKWHFSPLWDFGNAFNGPTDDFFYHHSPFGSTWIPSIRINSMFNDKVRETWTWFMSTNFNGVYDDIATFVSRIARAAISDHNRWNGVQPPSGGIPVCDNSDMSGRQEAALQHLNAKIAFLRTQFGNYTPGASVPEPARDTTPAAPLPDYVSGIENVETDGNLPSDAAPEYFDLTGRRITNPAPGTLLIERRGSSVRKLRF